MSRTAPITRPLLTALAGLAALAAGVLAPAAATAQAVRASELRYPTLPPFTIPQPERVTLDNGMVVLLLPDHELPLVEMTALVHAGPRYDPADKVGLAGLAAELMRTGGTASLSGDAVDDLLESHAASIELSVDDDTTTATLSALAADFPQVLRVFADVLRRPALDPAKLEVARAQAIAALSRRNDEPFNVLDREIRKLVYGTDSPYARLATFAGLRAIGRDDVVAWHSASLHPDRMIVGLVGDFQRDEALARIREAFGDWQRGPAWAPAQTPYQRARPGMYFARKDDVTQSFVGLGHLGVLRNDPDFYALDVLNQLFAGSFASRLFAEVRTRLGLAYTVWGGVDSQWDHPGVSGVFLSTKVETTGAAIDALLAQVRDLTEHPPRSEEIEKARQSLLNSFVFRFDAPAKVMRRQLLLEHYHYPLDWLARYQPGIAAVTVDDVRRAVRHLRSADFAMLVVGPAQGMDKPLGSYGEVTPVDISLPPDPAPAGAKGP
ncbi:MAG TPA: pitrilysin family protein [Thermoanaerobaculia bacterium]|jgi:zinc protease|nr:pitrilysin family protein [Thermoanaerobaculia bacterium]